ncbi:MAG: GGDEF domain-containing protein [Clostridiales bacterium]|nr:GGDEF domain-containing protein [Clostridiales bacterium]
MGFIINMQSVYITDLVGVGILVIILATKGWILPARRDESRIMVIMLILSVINCLVDILAFWCDGKAGAMYHAFLMIANTYLYLYNMVIGIGIIYMVIMHIDHKTSGLHMVFFWLLCVIEATLLIINLFHPIVFVIDEHNTYHRSTYYILFIMIGFILLLYGYFYYLINKIRNPALRYFPVIEFLSPILIGIIVQTKIYGISLLPVCFALAFVGIVIALQNECIYIDKLTGVYNRYELDKYLKQRHYRRGEKIAALMLDLNDFKSINDKYSHEEGDVALVAFADILVGVIGVEGNVIRFAGDEFIIIMSKFEDIDIKDIRKKILDAIDSYNASSGKPYKLSAAVGGRVFDTKTDDMADLINQIDSLMYQDKDRFYELSGRKR